MFNFLKDRLKKAVSSFSKKAEEEAEPVEKPEEKKKEEKPEKKKAKKPGKPAKKEKPQKKEPEKKEEKPGKKPAGKKPSKKEKPGGAEDKKAGHEKEAEEPGKKPEEEAKKPEEKKPEEKEEKPEEKEEAPGVKEEKEEKGFFGKLKHRFAKKEEKAEEKPEEKEEVPEEKPAEEEKEEEKPAEKEEEKEEEEPEKEKKGIFARVREAVSTKMLTESQFERMFWDLEIALLENNVAMEVVEKIKDDLKQNLVNKRIERGKFEDAIGASLHESISSLFDTERISLVKKAKENKEPYVVVFVGVNGSGKTTTIAKIAKLMQEKKLKPVIAAADTFRAAAIQQLEEHGSKLGVKVIKHDYGSDPAAVAFDAIKYSKSKDLDIVLIDTAGRQHSNMNLMDEMKKIIRVAEPDLKVFIGESITGNDCIEQAKAFNEAIGIDAIVLTKADVDEKGGAAVSVSYVTGKPILYLGMGQGYEDLKEFDRKLIMENIGLA